MSLIGLAAILTFGNGEIPAGADIQVTLYQVRASRKGPAFLSKELEPFRRVLRGSPYRRLELVTGFPRRLGMTYGREERIPLLGDGCVVILPHKKEGKPHLKVTLEGKDGKAISWFDRPNSLLLVTTPFRASGNAEILLILDRSDAGGAR